VDFFYQVPSGLEDLDGHRLFADQALELFDLLLELPHTPAGTTSSPAATAVVPPRSTSCIQLRKSAGWISSSRVSSASVFSPDRIWPTTWRLNSTENIRPPSAAARDQRSSARNSFEQDTSGRLDGENDPPATSLFKADPVEIRQRDRYNLSEIGVIYHRSSSPDTPTGVVPTAVSAM
jgi:hypothetical protein